MVMMMETRESGHGSVLLGGVMMRKIFFCSRIRGRNTIFIFILKIHTS
jgi:hypothetical protein